MPALEAWAVPPRPATTAAIAALKRWRTFRLTLRAEFVFMGFLLCRLVGLIGFRWKRAKEGDRRSPPAAGGGDVRPGARRPAGCRRRARRGRRARRRRRRWAGARARGTRRRGPHGRGG